MLIHRYGSDVPFFDEWDAVGMKLLVPRANHDLRAANFLLSHNEHRVLFTKLESYLLAVLNRQWDPLLEMSTNAAIHAGLCAAMVLLAGRLVTGIRFAAVAVLTTSLFSTAFDWENTLQGFQSQFYFLEWGALGMFMLCIPSEPLGRGWWAGWICGLAGLGAMASGFLAPLALLAVMGLRELAVRRWSRPESISAALLGALCVGGFLSVTQVPGLEIYRARSPAEWIWGAASLLSWPVPGWPVAFLVIQAPVALLMSNRGRSGTLRRDEYVLVALAIWSCLQVAALAYGRSHAVLDSSRYTDVLAVGLFANGAALAVIWRQRQSRTFFSVAALTWVTLVAIGLWWQDSAAHSTELRSYSSKKSAERRHVKAFLAGGGIDALKSAPPGELPYPSPDELGGFLSAQGIRKMLSLGIRTPIGLAGEGLSTGFGIEAAQGLPPGPEDRVWIARKGPARFVSQQLSDEHAAFLHLAVCGSDDLDGSVLRLESIHGGQFPLGRPPAPDHWQTLDLAVPREGPVRLVAEIPPGDHWLAFTEPVELGGGSWANRWLLRRSTFFATLSGAVLAVTLLAIVGIDIGRISVRGSGLQLPETRRG